MGNLPTILSPSQVDAAFDAALSHTGLLPSGWMGSSSIGAILNAGPATSFITGLAAFGSVPNADGLTVTAGNLLMQPADATHPGGVIVGAQTLGTGAKTVGPGAGTAIVLDPLGYGGYAQISIGAGLIGTYPSTQTIISGDSNLSLGTVSAPSILYLGGANGSAIADFTPNGRTICVFTFTDTSGTPGAGTANSASGTSALVATSGASFKITNSAVRATSLIIISYAGAPDSTAGALGASYVSGGFTVYSAGVAAGNTKFNWWVIN